MRRVYLFFLIGVLLLGLAGGVFWYFIKRQSSQAPSVNYELKYKVAQNLSRIGKLDESITAFQQIIDTVGPSESESVNIKARFSLAFDLFTRNNDDDRVRAATTYKEIIVDRSISNARRAVAVGKLLDFYNGTHNKAFATKIIFSDEPFGLFLKNGDIELAVRRAYEMAESLYPISLHESRIADWYGVQLRIGQLSANEQAEFLVQLKKWIEKAEANIPAFLKLGYPKSILGYLYEIQGINLTTLAIFSDKNYVPAEAAFKRSLDVLTTDNDIKSYNIELFVRYYYASMLADSYGNSRKSDIVELLQPIMSPPPPQFSGYHFLFFEFLKSSIKNKSSVLFQKEIDGLGIIVPEFRNFLKTQGLK